MPGLVPPARPKLLLRRGEGPGIHILYAAWKGVDGRDKPGHDASPTSARPWFRRRASQALHQPDVFAGCGGIQHRSGRRGFVVKILQRSEDVGFFRGDVGSVFDRRRER
ncbi:hypothetical protein CVM73_22870 [Bradyrhizobium forestalis]|uniref:Uncharacterized protein n=1 Tax=Bradyrhizobium forestalis TaxID=1419263 RepID=A0A2M8R561_9BRAD|nr:hypothetical protein CVM73_22870 [Bradyrhizobium forestalis]